MSDTISVDLSPSADNPNQTPAKAVIVLSGGQDSVTCLAQAVYLGKEIVGAVFFNYGQQHAEAEYNAAWEAINQFLPDQNPDNFLLELFLGDIIEDITQSNLIKPGGDVNTQHEQNSDLPASFVPGRNLLFLQLATMLAYKLGATEVITGVCQTDYSGYPDCRRETIESFEIAFNLGVDTARVETITVAVEDPEPDKILTDKMPMEQTYARLVETDRYIKIITPLMDIDKADTFKLADDIEALDWILENTHTGYTGSRAHRYEWGWGPPEGAVLDPASALRAKGWYEFKERYRSA